MKYKNIPDSTLAQDCLTIFDLACRGRMPHELAEELVYKLIQNDTQERSKSGDVQHQGESYHGKRN